jgi:hypothetical protein
MMSDSKTTRPTDEEERIILLNKLILERYGEWATRKTPDMNNNDEVTR